MDEHRHTTEYTTEYLSALQKKEILKYAILSIMKMEDIIPSEISKSQKDKTLYDSTYKCYLK